MPFPSTVAFPGTLTLPGTVPFSVAMFPYAMPFPDALPKQCGTTNWVSQKMAWPPENGATLRNRVEQNTTICHHKTAL